MNNLTRRIVAYETRPQVFTEAGEFKSCKSIGLLLNMILVIIYALPTTVQVKWLRLELLRCGVYLSVDVINDIITKMLENGSLQGGPPISENLN